MQFIEAFKIFDDDNSGKIPVNSFRFYMSKYGKMVPEEMDEMIMDILEMKKKAPIDPSTKLDYITFSDKVFNKPVKPPPGKPGKPGKPGR